MESRRQFLIVGATALGLVPLISWLGRPQAVQTGSGDRFPVSKTDAEWRAVLTPEQYHVLRGRGTERAHTSPLDREKRRGTFACAACGQQLFASETKYDSGTGWPSFWAPLPNAIGTSIDRSIFGMQTEVHCARCGSHLGHVFPDGPKPTGQRYCMNGVALTFNPAR